MNNMNSFNYPMQNGINNINSMNSINTMNNPMFERFVNNLQMTNPQQFLLLKQNPLALQQQFQNYLQTQAMMPNTTANTVNNAHMQTPPLMNTNNMNPQQNQNFNQNQIPNYQQMEQMLQMFKIFQMMQQMGVLNTQAIPGPANIGNMATVGQTAGQAAGQPSSPETKTDPEGTTYLPNGDKIIPLPNGQFGLIRKN